MGGGRRSKRGVGRGGVQVSSDRYLILTGVDDMGGGEEVFLEVRETKKKNSEYSQLYEAGRRRSWCAWTDGVDVDADWTGNAAGFCE